MRYRSGEISSRFLCTFALSLLLLPAVLLAAVPAKDLLVLGSDDRYWIAHFAPASNDPKSVPRTILYSRAIGSSTFASRGESDGRLVALAHRGTQLAVVEKDGTWTMISEGNTFSQGAELPNAARIIDLAGGEDTFWALGAAAQIIERPNAVGATTLPATMPATMPSTTQSATALPGVPAVASTLPTTAPATMPATTRAAMAPAGLFRLDNGVWTTLAPLPPEAVAGDIPASLSIINGTPYVAFVDDLRSVRVVQLEQNAWKEVVILSGDADVTNVSILRGTATPVLWITRDKGRQSLEFLYGDAPARHVPLSDVPATAQSVGIGYALGEIRVLVADKGSITEQSLDPLTAATTGPPVKLALHADVQIIDVDHLREYIIWGALLISIFGAMHWRRRMQGMIFDLEKIRLAPLSRRASAGGIDLFPLVIGAALLLRFTTAVEVEIVAATSIVLYVMLTALTEMIVGRSLGKWVMGLEVVSLTGDRPSRWALLVRNLLRVIDVLLVFAPLIVVILSPLRQRTGDVAAGTLVVQSVDKPDADKTT